MASNAKRKSANRTQKVRDRTEIGTERSKEVLETIGAATIEAAKVTQKCCSKALQGMQDYNSKLAEFAQVNTKCYVKFVQKLAAVRSPSELIEVSTDHGRQLETMAEQAKQLAELTQKVALATAEPFRTGLAKAYDHAA